MSSAPTTLHTVKELAERRAQAPHTSMFVRMLLRAAMLRVIEPISGEVTLERYEAVHDAQGKVVAYNAWILR